MNDLEWSNDTFYDGLQVQLAKRMGHGFQVQGSYTWSKAIDEGAGTVASDPFLNSINSLLEPLPHYRRSVADFNVPQNLVVNYIWDVPARKSLPGAIAWAAKGWELGGILQVRSGLPFTPLIAGDPLGEDTSSSFAYPNLVRTPACASPVNPGNVTNYIKLQCFALPMATPAIAAQCVPFAAASVSGTCSNLLGNGGRNEIYGPGLVNFDFSVFKNNQIKENLNLQFRAELFNVFNHPNFNSPIDNSTIFNQDGSPTNGAGAIDGTSNFSREIQLALKLIW